MQRCQSQFSSREVGQTLGDIDKQQSSITELKVFLEEATGLVRSHGHQLIQILKTMATKFDLVDGVGDKKEEEEEEKEEEGETMKLKGKGNREIRLLVTPWKHRNSRSPRSLP